MTSESDLLPRIIAATGLELDSEPMPAEFVGELLAREYDLGGTLTRIDTEKDDTFRLDADGARYLVKIAPAAEDPGIVNLQSAAMVHLQRCAPHIPAQRLIRGVRDQAETPVRDRRQQTRILRVLNYIDGAVLRDSAPSAEQLRIVGTTLAHLDAALATFRHPHESRLLLWDLKNFMHMRELVHHVDDPVDQKLAHSIFDRFDARVSPVLQELETQTIHGDFSPFNLVVNPDSSQFVAGVIDFGDVVRSPILFELSVPAANLIGMDAPRPWHAAAEVVRGYRQIHPVPDEVIDLLAVTAPARLLLRALVYGWRSAVDPGSREYAQAHSARDWHRLRAAVAVADDVVRTIFADTPSAVRPTF